DHPLLDVRVQATYDLLEPTAAGLTTDDEAKVLYALEDALLERLGTDAVLVARGTFNGTRTLMLMVDGQSTARATLEEVAQEPGGRAVRIEVYPDPGWQAQRKLLRDTAS